MSAMVLLQAERQDEIQHLHDQLKDGGILQRELWECAESFLIQKGIYDVTWIKEADFQEYKRYLTETGLYIRKRVIERTAALRNIQKHWIEKEYAELMAEIDECPNAEKPLKGNLKRFLIRQGIHHIREVDYPVRERYEKELKRTKVKGHDQRYLKTMDRVKQYDIRKEMSSLRGVARNRVRYREQILFLPYHPDQELAKDFEYTFDKQELVWDFTKEASDTLKRQVFLLLNYILENLYTDNPKERRVRYLLPLHWLYDFCVEESVEDLECLELRHIQGFQTIVEQKVVNVGNSMQIIDNVRKILFLTDKETHWYANVWYMERFHLQSDRQNPSNPVMRLTFLEVSNRKNRKLLQDYAQYHVGIGNLVLTNIRAQLYNVKHFMEYFEAEPSVCELKTEQLNQYFKELDEMDQKDDTYNMKITCIFSFYEYLYKKGFIKEIPFHLDYYIKKTYPVHHDRSVEEEIYMEVLNKLYLFPEIDRLIFLHLWCTGLRISEVCTLKGDAYLWDGEDAWLKIYQIKMKADKMIPIPLVLYKVMRIYMDKYQVRPKEYVFKSKSGGAYRVGSFVKSFRSHCEKNQIANSEYVFKSHDYRHTLATRFYDDGVSIQTVRDYLGHFTEDMTKQYVDYMTKKVEKANEDYFKKPGNNLAMEMTVKKRGDKK